MFSDSRRALPGGTSPVALRGLSASINFVDKTSGYSFSAFAKCTAAAGVACPLSFTGPVYPGIYTVSVSGTYLNEMPGASYRAIDLIQLQ